MSELRPSDDFPCIQAKKEARAIVRLRKDNDAFSEVFSNPSISSNDASVFGRLGLMADHSAPGMRQVLIHHYFVSL